MAQRLIDLYSDTATKPTAEMRRFMAEAEVGDEQKGEDPSVNELQRLVAEMLGKEAAVFLPSGTMCNLVALTVHCRPGDLILLDRTAHPLNAEAGGTAVVSGAIAYPLDGVRGMFTAEQVAQAIYPPSRNRPSVRAVSVEQTTNTPGGCIWPLEQVRAVCAVAREHSLATHMDGARLFNASVATGVSVADYAATFDSVWIDLSKGLGAPVGAVLAGSGAFIESAWQWKQRLGGAMRQAGIVAAGGIYALRHHVARLAEDHANARRLAHGIAGAPGIRVADQGVETNIVRIEVTAEGLTARAFTDRLLAEGVRLSTPGRQVLRAVTHLDVSQQDVDLAGRAICGIAERFAMGS